MERQRNIAMVAKKVSFAEAEEADINYWMSLTPTQRLTELYSLKQMNWTSKYKPYPQMEKIAEKKIKNQTDEDDF
ncbi:MAG: hypothetical protein ABIN67_11425 [Ferruginibacter sp.]